MAKTTMFLITFLVLLAAGLVLIAVKNAETPPKVVPVIKNTPTPTPKLTTKIYMMPNPVTLVGNTATVKVLVDASSIDVAAVQLELSYDPQILFLQSIKPSKDFTKSLPVVNTVDKTSGRISYILNRSASDPSVFASSSAEVATMLFSKIGSASGSAMTDISFLPKSLVTARGNSQPVVTTEGTEVMLIRPTLFPPSQIPRFDRISPTK